MSQIRVRISKPTGLPGKATRRPIGHLYTEKRRTTQITQLLPFSSCLKMQGYTKHQANEPRDLGTSIMLYSGNSNKLTTVTLLSLRLPTLAV